LEFTDIIPYLIAALTFISISYALRRYFMLRAAAKSADFQEFRQEADTLGNAARKKAEEKVDAMFAPYITKGNHDDS
jgi:hypothetical protein